LFKFLINKVKKNDFLKSVSIVSIGTIISQIIILSVYPFITRYYAAETFGEFSLFTSIGSLLIIFSTSRYENAFVLISTDEKAKELFKLIFYISLITSFFYFIVIFISNQLQFFNQISDMFYLLPLYTAIIAIYTGLGSYHERLLNYKLISKVLVLQAFSASFCNILFGLFFPSEFGLFFSLIFGGLIGIIFLLLHVDFQKKGKENYNVYSLAKEFFTFPKYMIASDLALAASLNFMPIIFGTLFDMKVVGFYALASRVLRIPNLLLANSIGSVLKNHAMDEIRSRGNCYNLFITTLKRILYFAVPIYAIIYFFSTFIFALLFGEFWIDSGKMAQILSISFLFEFVFAPFKSFFNITNNNRTYLYLQIGTLGCGILSVYIGYFLSFDVFDVLICYSFVNVCFALLGLYQARKISRGDIVYSV